VAKKGYTNIKIFRDGIQGWTNAGFSINKASKKVDFELPVIEPEQLNTDLDDYLVLDIRPASIYEFGYIPNSRAMPLPYLSMLSAELPRNRKIVVVDHLGKQCKKAAQWLMNNGFEDVSILKDGLTGYKRAGFELETK
jgi:rhodanese-related sulfurtransferase